MEQAVSQMGELIENDANDMRSCDICIHDVITKVVVLTYSLYDIK